MIIDEIELNRLEAVLMAVLAASSKAEHARSVDRLASVIYTLPDIEQREKVIVASRVLRDGEPDPVGLVIEYVMKIVLDK